MSWGISYLGSKSKIVKHILPHLPAADNFVDLFAGGGAVTHYAMTTGKYKHFIYNDLNPLAVKGFEMALNGDFEKDKRWISNEDFFRLRDTDPYVAICFSFSNDTHSYIYGRAIEPVKEAYHYAIFFDDYSLAKERIGIDLSPLAECKTIDDKYTMLKRIVKNAHTQQSIETRLQSMERKQRATITFSLLQHFQVENIESLKRCCDVGNTCLSDVIEFHNTDYQNVSIPDNSVAYCDIPYHNTTKYRHKGKGIDFDYERFYKWCEDATFPVFISEYWMPEDRFKCIAEIKRTCTVCANKNFRVIERLFIPINQQHKTYQQLKLF